MKELGKPAKLKVEVLNRTDRLNWNGSRRLHDGWVRCPRWEAGHRLDESVGEQGAVLAVVADPNRFQRSVADQYRQVVHRPPTRVNSARAAVSSAARPDWWVLPSSVVMPLYLRPFLDSVKPAPVNLTMSR